MTLRIAISTIALSILATTIAHADCKSDIQNILKSMETSGPYKMEMKMDSAGTASVMNADVIMPHSMRMKGEGIDMVMTPNGVWMAHGGALQKMPDGMKEQVQGMIKQGMNMGVQAVDRVECLGSTNFENETFTHFKYTAKADFMGINSKSSVDMYVNDQNKPVWLVVDGEAMGTKSLTRQHITYDDSIVIADPQ